MNGASRRPYTRAAALLVLGLGLLLLFLGVEWFWMVFAIGFFVVVPLVALATGEPRRRLLIERLLAPASTPEPVPEAADLDTALVLLRERYACGELDEEAFERRLERLLETETVADAVRERDRRRGREAA